MGEFDDFEGYLVQLLQLLHKAPAHCRFAGSNKSPPQEFKAFYKRAPQQDPHGTFTNQKNAKQANIGLQIKSKQKIGLAFESSSAFSNWKSGSGSSGPWNETTLQQVSPNKTWWRTYLVNANMH